MGSDALRKCNLFRPLVGYSNFYGNHFESDEELSNQMGAALLRRLEKHIRTAF